MELQQRKFSCGPAAARAVLYFLGHRVSEAALCKWAGTTKEGTDEKGMLKALTHYGHKGKEYQADSGKKSWNWLKAALGRGNPVLLCVDQWGHWVAAVGKLGGKILIFDPDSSGGRKKYSGLNVYDEKSFVERWGYYDKDSNKNIYYGISVR